jgi:hypothetical protein
MAYYKRAAPAQGGSFIYYNGNQTCFICIQTGFVKIPNTFANKKPQNSGYYETNHPCSVTPRYGRGHCRGL